jgi:hypothetical protein
VPAAPAVAATALKATRLAGGDAETARLIVEGVARAVRGGGLPAPEPECDATYDPALVNADCDLAALEADLLPPGALRAVSALVSGPPGTGKSAWIRHLASRMGMPVLQKHRRRLYTLAASGSSNDPAYDHHDGCSLVVSSWSFFSGIEVGTATYERHDYPNVSQAPVWRAVVPGLRLPEIVNGRAERTGCQPTANGGLQD